MPVTGIQGQPLEVNVVGCRNLRDTEWITRQDPYVVIEYGNQRFRTKTDTDGGKNPSFNQKFTIPLIEGLREINVQVWNSNTLSFDDHIGSGRVQIEKALSTGYDDTAWPLTSKHGKYAGEVRFILHYANAKSKPYATPSPSAPPYSSYPAAPYPSAYPPVQGLAAGYSPQGSSSSYNPPTAVPYAAPPAPYAPPAAPYAPTAAPYAAPPTAYGAPPPPYAPPAAPYASSASYPPPYYPPAPPPVYSPLPGAYPPVPYSGYGYPSHGYYKHGKHKHKGHKFKGWKYGKK